MAQPWESILQVRPTFCCTTWKESFVFKQPAIKRTLMRLTVWDHDLGGVGNDFYGQVEMYLRDHELPLTVDAMKLRPLLDKKGNVKSTAEGSISFELRSQAPRRGGMARRLMTFTSKAQELLASEGEALLDDQEQICEAMDKKARFMHEAVGRLNRSVGIPLLSTELNTIVTL